MKVGIRKPSLKKSISARTTGRAKRKLKRMVNPFYGKKGVGFIKNPSKSIKAKIYRKTTISAKDASKGIGALILFPFYLTWYAFVFFWYIMKIMFVAVVWVTVQIVNLCVMLVEWLINLRAQEQPFEESSADETVGSEENGKE